METSEGVYPLVTSHSTERRVVCRKHQHRKVVRAVRVEARKQVCLSGRRYPRPTATEVRIRNGGRIVYASLQHVSFGEALEARKKN